MILLPRYGILNKTFQEYLQSTDARKEKYFDFIGKSWSHYFYEAL